jgi:serine protease Do
MGKVRTAAAWVAVGAVVFALGFAVARVQGQESRRDRDFEAPMAHAFAWADFSGGQIGVTVREADADDAKGKQGVSVGSVIVEDVREDSPASRAGIQTGDVILEWDGERVRSARQFRRLVEETAEGRSAPVVLSRNGTRSELSVTPERREFSWMRPGVRVEPPVVSALPRLREFERLSPDIGVVIGGQGRLGVQVETLTDQLAAHLGVKQGVLVTSVAPDTPASRAGIKAGDVITSIDGEAVQHTGDVRRQLRRIEDDREFALEITREKKPVTVKARLEARRASRRGTTTF